MSQKDQVKSCLQELGETFVTLLKNLDFSMITESFQERYLDIALSNSTHVVSLNFVGKV